MPKQRLDSLLVERRLVKSRHQAQLLIMAGKVHVNSQSAIKPGQMVPIDALVTIEESLPYVSRGGLKLEAALDSFHISVKGAICADVGASTGGFTDCLLQRGALKSYVIDVGYGQLDWSLRNDPRVVVMERTNARYLHQLPEKMTLVTVDVSFISLEKILPVVAGWLAENGRVIALIKPQFEAGKEQVGKGGVIRDTAIHRQVLIRVMRFAAEIGFSIEGLITSPLRGPAGNIEFLAYLSLASPGEENRLIEGIIDKYLTSVSGELGKARET